MGVEHTSGEAIGLQQGDYHPGAQPSSDWKPLLMDRNEELSLINSVLAKLGIASIQKDELDPVAYDMLLSDIQRIQQRIDEGVDFDNPEEQGYVGKMSKHLLGLIKKRQD